MEMDRNVGEAELTFEMSTFFKSVIYLRDTTGRRAEQLNSKLLPCMKTEGCS